MSILNKMMGYVTGNGIDKTEKLNSKNMTHVVRYFPKKGSDLEKVAKELNRESLSAIVESENEDGTLNLIVQNPNGSNDLVKDVSEKEYEEVQ